MKNKNFLGIIFSLIVMLTVGFGVAGSSPTINPNDNFDDNSIDTSKWTVNVSSTGSVVETNQELQVELTSDSSGSVFQAGLRAKWLISGDFDIQVDYHLINWPSDNGIRVGLSAGGITTRGYPDVVERVSFSALDFPSYSPREVYLVDFSDGVQGITSTNDAYGRLRLVRSGSTMTGYYFDFAGNNWVALHSASTSTDDGSVEIMIWGHNSTPGVKVAFDNFTVNSGNIVVPVIPPSPVPELPSLVLFVWGLAGLGILKLRRRD